MAGHLRRQILDTIIRWIARVTRELLCWILGAWQSLQIMGAIISIAFISGMVVSLAQFNLLRIMAYDNSILGKLCRLGAVLMFIAIATIEAYRVKRESGGGK